MHITILTLLAAGTSAQFVESFVPQVAHAYGLEGPGEWHQITDNSNNHNHHHDNQHHQHHINQHQAATRPTATPSTMMPMIKPSIKPYASSFPYASGMFVSSSSAAPSYSPSYGYAYDNEYAGAPTPSANNYYMASTTPTHRPGHDLHLHQAPPHAANPRPAGHGSAVAPDGHIGVPAGGMGVPPSAQAPEPLNAGRSESESESEEQSEEMSNPNAGDQSDIAPTAPLAPGTNVAPVQVHDTFGADKGNSFCLGQCFASAEEAQCGPPYGSPVLQSEGCYTCCFSPNDDF